MAYVLLHWPDLSVCLAGRGGHGVAVEGLCEWKPMQMPALRTEAGSPGDLSLWVQ